MSKITIDRAVAEQALEALLNEGEFRKILKPLIEKSIDSIREALDQPDAGIPATVPAGWKLVPVVPTDAMLDAVRTKGGPQAVGYAIAAWSDLLEAAPQYKGGAK